MLAMDDESLLAIACYIEAKTQHRVATSGLEVSFNCSHPAVALATTQQSSAEV